MDPKFSRNPTILKVKKRTSVVHFHNNGSGVSPPKKANHGNMPGMISDNRSPLKPNGAPLETLKQRRSLPVYAARSRLIEYISKHSTLIIIGETGSGKTTQIPQFIYEQNLHGSGVIAITQPRRVAAVSLSRRVAEEMHVSVGDIVGYSIRFEDMSSPETKLRFVTDGMLFREAMLDELLLNYSFIILDEAHERSINTEVLFGIVKKAQERRAVEGKQPLHIIIMSATMDVDHFSKYFNNAEVIYLEGRQYPVQVYNAKVPQDDYVQSCVSTIFQIHMSEPLRQDILVFLTGQEEIESLAGTIRSAAKDLTPPLKVFPLYSSQPMAQINHVFRPTPPTERKVILSTNVAETSITIPGIKFVIDSCHVKARTYQPGTGLDLLKVQRVSQAQAWQRTGRAGRDSDGKCYRVLTQQEFNDLPENTVPEILRCNLASVVLQLLQVNIDAYSFDFMDKPSKEALDVAVQQLKLLGSIDSVETRKLTPLGSKMAQFPLDPRLSKILLSSKDYGCTEEVLCIVALLSGESVFILPFNKREEALEKHKKFVSSEGDHITLLNVFRAFKQNYQQRKQYCFDNFLNVKNLDFAEEVRKQLADLCVKNDIPVTSMRPSMDQVRKCLVTGYFTNIAELQRDRKYMTIGSRQRVRIHPSSVLHLTLPHYVLYSEVVSSSQCFIRNLCIVDPEMLKEVAPEYFRDHRLGSDNQMALS